MGTFLLIIIAIYAIGYYLTRNMDSGGQEIVISLIGVILPIIVLMLLSLLG